jgi:hypothetical protein
MLEICDICSTKFEIRWSTPEQPYHYTESGLGIVFLIGVETFNCSKCNEGTAAIPDIGGLHKLIATALFGTSEPLTPREFMFLRKEMLLGLPELSKRMGVEREVISTFERAEVPSLRHPVNCAFDNSARTWSVL